MLGVSKGQGRSSESKLNNAIDGHSCMEMGRNHNRF